MPNIDLNLYVNDIYNVMAIKNCPEFYKNYTLNNTKTVIIRMSTVQFSFATRCSEFLV